MKKALARIAIKGAVTLMAILLIITGIQFLTWTNRGQTMDLLTSNMAVESGTSKEALQHSLGLDKPFRPDIWPFDNKSVWSSNPTASSSSTTVITGSTSSSFSSPSPTTSSSTAYPSYSSNTIGLSVGGAKDIANFRENIENDFLPLPTDVTYEGLFYDYYFDSGITRACTELFCPSYSAAVTKDPLSGQPEYYISVGLNSGLKESDFERKLLNLVIVMDVSGSMDACFNEYYYDGSGNRIYAYENEGIYRKKKIDCAKDAVVTILNQLNDKDRFAIVTFDTNSRLLMPMELVGRANSYDVEDSIRNISANGSTNLDAGMDLARAQFRRLTSLDSSEYENRIIVLTDAQPNTGQIGNQDFVKNVQNSADDRVYTTFIGSGVDFNSQLIESITKVRGANYYSVNSPREFRRRIEEEFDFMVTPLVFNLRLNFESRGWRIDQVFGSPEADYATGSLMTINTLFPSKSEGGETKGGLVLLKLRRISSEPDERIYLRVTYEDRNGRKDSNESVVYLETQKPEFFENSGIRKGILLSRYAALLKNWITDERQYYRDGDNWHPCINEDTGIKIPQENRGQWERQSLTVRVSEPWSRIFRDFSHYFQNEIEAIGDNQLEQEIDVLKTLYTY